MRTDANRRASSTSRPNVADSLDELEEGGYEAQFIPKAGTRMQCGECRAIVPADELLQRTARRVDVETDPDQQSLVSALECPRCHAKGTYAFSYGPGADANESEILRILREDRSREERRKL